jgi:hypothetical protein
MKADGVLEREEGRQGLKDEGGRRKEEGCAIAKYIFSFPGSGLGMPVFRAPARKRPATCRSYCPADTVFVNFGIQTVGRAVPAVFSAESGVQAASQLPPGPRRPQAALRICLPGSCPVSVGRSRVPRDCPSLTGETPVPPGDFHLQL